MNTQELKNKITELREKGYVYFALQDKPGKLTKASCGRFYPTGKGAGWVKNGDDVEQNLIEYVQKFPDFYTFHFSRQLITAGTESFNIDTRTPGEQTEIPTQTLSEPMDERTKDERRTDELTIRSLMQQNATLTAEVKRLEEKISELEDEIEAISTEADENKHAQMADATTSTIGQIAQILPALVDKYFQIQEQKNALLAEQMMQQRNRQQYAPNVEADPVKQRPFYQQNFENEG
jgi:hypothetical protein